MVKSRQRGQKLTKAQKKNDLVAGRRSRRQKPGWSSCRNLPGRLAQPHEPAEDIPYQVCLSCGSKRLSNEETCSACGRFRCDWNELISPEKSAKSEPRRLECQGKENICRPAQ